MRLCNRNDGRMDSRVKSGALPKEEEDKDDVPQHLHESFPHRLTHDFKDLRCALEGGHMTHDKSRSPLLEVTPAGLIVRQRAEFRARARRGSFRHLLELQNHGALKGCVCASGTEGREGCELASMLSRVGKYVRVGCGSESSGLHRFPITDRPSPKRFVSS